MRPWLARQATELKLAGFARNGGGGVELEAEGPEPALIEFIRRIKSVPPANARIDPVIATDQPVQRQVGFQIEASSAHAHAKRVLAADMATCSRCRKELFDATNRRFRYPFISCAECGPRYSIVQRLPFDRERTSMGCFPLCSACQAEYEDPTDRRFHAQTIACPTCGPQVRLTDNAGKLEAVCEAALAGAIAAIRTGQIVAVKGIGGFHLVVRADDFDAVDRLRHRKSRYAKPLAVMFESLEEIENYGDVSDEERRLLAGPAAPIVLLRRRTSRTQELAANVAPDSPLLGCFLPYSPLHHWLARGVGAPLVVTSGNRSGEALCRANDEALQRLRHVADCFLLHDRDIINPVDDSLARIVLDRPMLLRRARGYVPAKIDTPHASPPLLAVGAHQKNAPALLANGEIHLAPHVGDLEEASALDRLESLLQDLPGALGVEPQAVACDLHPDYGSTRLAARLSLPTISVQHHHAHILSCMAEHSLEAPLLGVAWDGSGLGADGVIWGGEFLVVADRGYQRVAHLRPFRLPGGEQAIREPRRVALALLWDISEDRTLGKLRELGLDAAFSDLELKALSNMLARNLQSPATSSMGRLFDGVAALLRLRPIAQFEGQAAVDLENAASTADFAAKYAFAWEADGTLDWKPVVEHIVADRQAGVSISRIAAGFHEALADAIVLIARKVGQRRVVLSGGCFQNAYLLSLTVRRLRESHFEPFWNQMVPINDGGIAVGQILAAAQTLQTKP
jgi:hydrogenase maturation protein HypF